MSAHQKAKKKIAARPTESSTALAGVLAAVLAQVFGVHNADLVSSLAVVLGGLPAVVTSLVVMFRKPSA